MSVASEQVNLVLTKDEEKGTNAETDFHKIFSVCRDREAEFGVIPWVVGTKRYRANYACSSTEEYYRRATFISCIDDLKGSLKCASLTMGKHCSLQFVYPPVVYHPFP